MLDRRISFIIAAKCSLKDLQVGVRQMPEKEPTRQPLAGEDASIPVSMMTPSTVSSPIATSISSTMTTTGPLMGWRVTIFTCFFILIPRQLSSC